MNNSVVKYEDFFLSVINPILPWNCIRKIIRFFLLPRNLELRGKYSVFALLKNGKLCFCLWNFSIQYIWSLAHECSMKKSEWDIIMC